MNRTIRLMMLIWLLPDDMTIRELRAKICEART